MVLFILVVIIAFTAGIMHGLKKTPEEHAQTIAEMKETAGAAAVGVAAALFDIMNNE